MGEREEERAEQRDESQPRGMPADPQSEHDAESHIAEAHSRRSNQVRQQNRTAEHGRADRRIEQVGPLRAEQHPDQPGDGGGDGEALDDAGGQSMFTPVDRRQVNPDRRSSALRAILTQVGDVGASGRRTPVIIVVTAEAWAVCGDRCGQQCSAVANVAAFAGS